MTPTFKFNIGDKVRCISNGVVSKVAKRMSDENKDGVTFTYVLESDNYFYEDQLELVTEPPKREVWGLFWNFQDSFLTFDCYKTKEAALEATKGEEFKNTDYFIKRIVLED